MAKRATRILFIIMAAAFLVLQYQSSQASDPKCNPKALDKVLREIDEKVGSATAATLYHTGSFAATVACTATFEVVCHTSVDFESAAVGAGLCIIGGVAFGEACHGAVEYAKHEKSQERMKEKIVKYFNDREANLADHICKYVKGSILVKNDLHDDYVEFRAIISGAPDAHSHPKKVGKRGTGVIHPKSRHNSFTIEAKVNRSWKRDVHLKIHDVKIGRDVVVVYHHAGHYHITKHSR